MIFSYSDNGSRLIKSIRKVVCMQDSNDYMVESEKKAIEQLNCETKVMQTLRFTNEELGQNVVPCLNFCVQCSPGARYLVSNNRRAIVSQDGCVSQYASPEQTTWFSHCSLFELTSSNAPVLRGYRYPRRPRISVP